ncbi:hypothetical protein BH10ACI2_BH10ACI2_17130 [soil metagenome]
MSNKEIFELFEQLYRQMQMQLGSAVITSRWFHSEDDCPGCGRKIAAMKFKGKQALSLNTFIFREHGVLIAYLLCGKCAKYIFKESKTNPNSQTPLHIEIEKILKNAFLKKQGH